MALDRGINYIDIEKINKASIANWNDQYDVQFNNLVKYWDLPRFEDICGYVASEMGDR